MLKLSPLSKLLHFILLKFIKVPYYKNNYEKYLNLSGWSQLTFCYVSRGKGMSLPTYIFINVCYRAILSFKPLKALKQCSLPAFQFSIPSLGSTQLPGLE